MRVDADKEYARLRRAIAGEPLPVALIDLDALDANVARLVEPARRAGKRVRIASKSIRCLALIQRVAERSDGVVDGVMAYAARECPLLVAAGFRDVLVAYPSVNPHDLAALARANRDGASASIVVDAIEHVEAASRAAREASVQLPLVVDVDVSYRPARRVHLGVRRSPIRTADDVIALASRIADRPELRFDGVMGYEAQIAGVQDTDVGRRVMKALSMRDVVATRASIVDALRARGLPPRVVNGGGTGSLDANVGEAALTEITVGSGFVASHLFDRYRGLALRPAAFFALQVVRRPAPRIVTCHGGGWIGSGAAGTDRLPRPTYPAGLSLLPMEGAGEVQTPLAMDRDAGLAIGDPVFFRHAKAGELAEHVNEYVLLSGDTIVDRAATYRGMGHAFLG